MHGHDGWPKKGGPHLPDRSAVVNSNTKPAEAATPTSAILLVIAACFLFSFLDSSAKYLVLNGMAAPFVTWVRFTVHVFLVLILFRAWSQPAMFHTTSKSGQFVRGVFMFGSTIFNFLALQTLQLAETVSIYFFGPMLITALAGPLLGEHAGWRRWLAILVGFIGVMIITRPGLGAFGIGHVYAFLAVVSQAFYVIMTRKMGATETSESLIFYSALVPAILMLPVVPIYGSMPQESWHWLLLLGLGFFGGFGHYLLIRAYKIATTSALAPYPYSQMLWMIGLGWLIFDDLPDAWTLLGAGIIVSSGLYILHREHRLRLASRTTPNGEADHLAKKL